MAEGINYAANPLHGLSLKNLLIEVVDHYGFDILFAYLNLNCFKTNPSIESSLKFLQKTDWARENLESFYLYRYKNLPKASYEQLQLPPRDRIVPEEQVPGEPAKLSFDDAENVRNDRAVKAAAYKASGGKDKPRYKEDSRYADRKPARTQGKASASTTSPVDPWAKAKAKKKRS